MRRRNRGDKRKARGEGLIIRNAAAGLASAREGPGWPAGRETLQLCWKFSLIGANGEDFRRP